MGMQALQRIAAQDPLDRRAEDLAQLQVDAANGAVEIDLLIEVEPRAEEHVERLSGMGVEGQATLRDKGIVKDPLDVHGARGDTTYIGIARDVIHVVG